MVIRKALGGSALIGGCGEDLWGKMDRRHWTKSLLEQRVCNVCWNGCVV